MNTSESHFDAVPEDLRDLADRLDDLAAHDRTAAPGLEDRLFAATRAALPGSGHEPLALQLAGRSGRETSDGRSPGSAGSRRLWTPMRLAAAVAICSAGAAVWLASATWNGTEPTSPPGDASLATAADADAELDYLVALAGMDEGWDPLNERLHMLKLETDAVAGTVLWELGLSGLLLSEGVTR